jgi:hypothetical protein
MPGSILLYISKRKSPEVIVCDKAPLIREGKYLGDVDWGKLRRFPAEEFRRIGMEIVLASLGEYSARDGNEKSEYESLEKKEKQKLDYNHHQVLVWATEDSRLVVQDRRRRERQIAIPRTADSEKLFITAMKVLDLH